MLTFTMTLFVCCQQEEIEPTSTQSQLPSVATDTVTDSDGNEYNTVVIGTQEWMAENLKTTKYCNGDIIPNIPWINNQQWVTLTTPAWGHYDNDNQYDIPYGKLYNWLAVSDERNICPCGWHVPTDAEWTILVNHLGGPPTAGNKMKLSGTEYWWSPNTGSTNESGFSGLPGGIAGFTFDGLGGQGWWWSSNDLSGWVWIRMLSVNSGFVLRDAIHQVSIFGFGGPGLSIRCLKD